MVVVVRGFAAPLEQPPEGANSEGGNEIKAGREATFVSGACAIAIGGHR